MKSSRRPSSDRSTHRTGSPGSAVSPSDREPPGACALPELEAGGAGGAGGLDLCLDALLGLPPAQAAAAGDGEGAAGEPGGGTRGGGCPEEVPARKRAAHPAMTRYGTPAFPSSEPA